MRIAAVAVVVLLVTIYGAPSPAASPSAIARFTLVVGSNRSPSEKTKTLRFADDDAARNYELFEQVSTRIELLTVLDAASQQRFTRATQKAIPPTKAAFVSALSALFRDIERARDMGKETEFYFLYSGHGRLLPGREGAVTLQDGELTRSDLYAMVIEKSPADFNHLIIDACNSYYLVNPRGEAEATGEWKDDRSGQVRDEVAGFFSRQQLDSHPQTGVILSTSSEAETHEWEMYQGGIFSHEIRSGLLGGADVTDDGFIEYSELGAFVRAANYRLVDKRAKLDIYVRPPAKALNRPIFDLLAIKEAALLHLPANYEGPFYLEDDRGVRYADIHKSADYTVTLALLKGTSYFLRDVQNDTEYRVNPEDGFSITAATLAPQPMAATARGAVAEGFRSKLFSQSFGPDFYAGMTEALGWTPAMSPSRTQWPRMSTPAEPIIDDEEKWRKPVAIGSAVLAMGSIGAATVFAWQAGENRKQYTQSLELNGSYLKKRDQYAVSAIGLGVTGIALAGFSIYQIVKIRRAKKTRDARCLRRHISFNWTPGLAGISGSF
jgi:hypothetical protein